MACVVCNKSVDKGIAAGADKKVQLHYSCAAFVIDGLLGSAKTRKVLRAGVRYARDHAPWNDAEDWEAGDERNEFLVE